MTYGFIGTGNMGGALARAAAKALLAQNAGSARLVPASLPDAPPSAPVDFGWVKTAEAFRLVSEPGRPDRKTLLPSGLPAAVPVATTNASQRPETPRTS